MFVGAEIRLYVNRIAVLAGTIGEGVRSERAALNQVQESTFGGKGAFGALV